MSRHPTRPGIRALAGTAVVALFGLTGCSGRPAGDALFPLEPGHRWTYRLTTELENNTTERETLTLRTTGADALEGGPAFRRQGDNGVTYWLRSDASGVVRVASKTDVEADPQPDQPPRHVLKAPFVPGTQWQASTTAYLLQRRNDFPREIRYSHPSIPMQYQIEATDERVDTPAGRFERCLRVKGSATVRLYADPTSGWKDMPLTTQEWYCPGVGLTKLERSEPAGNGFLIGGRLTMELQSWE